MSATPLATEIDEAAVPPVRRAAVVAVLLVALLFAGLAAVLLREYHHEVDIAERYSAAVAAAVEREASARLLGLEQQFATAAARIRQRPADADVAVEAARALGDVSALHPGLAGLALLDGHGAVLAGPAEAVVRPPDPRAGGRGLHLAAPEIDAASGRWVLPLEYPVALGSNGSGRIVALLDVDALETLLAGHGVGAHGVVMLVHLDGRVVARSREHDSHVGADARGLPMFADALAGPAGGSGVAPGPFDSVDRIYSYRRFEQVPLVALAALSREEMLAGWRRFMAASIAAVTAFVGAGLLMFRIMLRAQNRQRALLRRLRATTENLGDAQRLARMGHWELDVEAGTITLAPELVSVFGAGLQAGTHDYEPLFALVHPDDRDAVRQAHQHTLETGEPFDVEHRVVLPDIGERVLRSRGMRGTNAEGHTCLTGTTQDISEPARARERLRSAQAQYRLLFDHNPLPMWIYSTDTLRFLAVNAAAVAHYGYSEQEFLARTILEIRPPEDVPEVLAVIRTWSNEDRRGRVWRHLRADGSTIYVAVYSSDTVFDEQRARLVLAQDVTDRIRAEEERARSELRFSIVARAASDAIYDWDIVRGLIWWSDGFYDLYGYRPDTVEPTIDAWEQGIHPDDRAAVAASLQQAIDRGDERWQSAYRFLRADGSYAEVEDRGHFLRDGAGVAVRMIGGMLDVTERRRGEARLRLLQRAIESSDNGVVIVDALGAGAPVVYVNPAFERLTGVAAADMIGRRVADGNRVADEVGAAALRNALSARRSEPGVVHHRLPDGRDALFDVHAAPVRDDAGQLTHWVDILTDITAREMAQSELAHRATHDPLTGLPNRALITDRLAAMIRGCAGGGAPPAAVFIGLDHFKLINDTLGHAVGDRVLVAVAQRLLAAAPQAHCIGRFGGDEFVLLFEEREPGGTEAQIPTLVDALTQPIEVLDTLHYLTPSVGHGVHPDAGADAESMLKNVDLAMYQAKQRGRNNVVAYAEELGTSVAERLRLVSRLRRALANDEFELHFQPKYRSSDLAPVGLEALLRWNDPDRGRVPPDEFIDVAEDSGLIVPIGRWVLREAARHHARLVAAGLGSVSIAVNVSPPQFQRGQLLEDVRALAAEFALPPGALEIELTESVIMEHPESTIEQMGALRALGVTVAIDDFGTGYSNLGYLKRLPVDTLKIDRSFIADLGHDPESGAVCAAIITLARNFNRSVVAEGVETNAQFAWLREHDCDIVQGFRFARPTPFDEALVALRNPG